MLIGCGGSDSKNNNNEPNSHVSQNQNGTQNGNTNETNVSVEKDKTDTKSQEDNTQNSNTNENVAGNQNDDTTVTTNNDKYFKFSNDFLNGKTFYLVLTEKHNSYVRLSFTDKYMFETNYPDNKMEYKITKEGYLSFKEQDGENRGKDVYFKAANNDSDKISIKYAFNKNELPSQEITRYFFKDEQKAKDFVNSL